MIIYLDNCCYSRLFDAITSTKIGAEAKKIQLIIDNLFLGDYKIIGSLVLTSEMSGIDDYEKREAVEEIYDRVVTDEVRLSAQTIVRADELRLSMGLGVMDSRHLAAAEAAKADFLLTTDADFIKKCAKKKLTNVKVINPLDF